MFPRFAAHARPGGALMFTSAERHAEAVGSGRASRSTTAASTPTGTNLLAETAFTTVEHRSGDPECGAVWLARAATA